ncbi:FIS1 isoform 5 [Pan troglodytes]|uniref:Fission, mitochondrial 1 n=3 Tax=Hominidae TaxID=9604 RepID=F8WBT1_HUMAN|nr:FIS1 isoform 5 [Pan troglodytes]PNJ85594.1 FIS1 isoform 5 [Pongo abelii]
MEAVLNELVSVEDLLSCCPKGARRNSGITSSTWPWGTTGSRNTRRP